MTVLRMNVNRLENILAESIPEHRKAFSDFVDDLQGAENAAAACKPEISIKKIWDAVENRREILNKPYMKREDAHEFALETLHALQDISGIVQDTLKENCGLRVNRL